MSDVTNGRGNGESHEGNGNGNGRGKRSRRVSSRNGGAVAVRHYGASRFGVLEPANASLIPPALAARMNTQELLKAVGDRWPLALVLASCVAVGIAVATWHFWPQPQYTARAYLYVSAVPPKVMFATSENRADFGTYQRRQMALIKSRMVLNTALRDPKVIELPVIRTQSNPTDWLEKELRVDDGHSPEFLRISMEGDEPESLSTIVNAVTEAYLKEIVNKEHNERLEHLDRLKRLHTDYENNLKRKRDTRRRLAEDAGSSDSHTLQLRQRLASEQLHQTQKALLDTRLDIRRLEADVAASQSRLKATQQVGIDGKRIDEAVEQEPSVQEIAGRAQGLETKIRQIREAYEEGHEAHAVAKHLEELDKLKDSLERRRESVRATLVAKAEMERSGESQTALAHASQRLAFMQELERSLNDDIGRLSQEVRNMNLSSLDLDALNREIAQAELTTGMVSQEVERMNVELQAPPRVSRLEEAVVSRPSDSRRRLFASGLAAMGGFGLFILAIAWREFNHRRVQSSDQVVHGLGMELVGTIPYVPGQARRAGVARLQAKALSESVDAVRAILLRESRLGSVRSVMVTSAVSGEGKTSLACHLAASMARAGKKTLLIDADMRNPAVHACFDLALEPGLAEVLRGEADVASCIQPTTIDGLFVLGAGRADGAALRALAREGVGKLFETLKDQCDFILIDSCPVLPVADSLQLGQHVDAVVLSVLRRVTRLPDVYSAWQRLAHLGIRVLGAVMNGAKRHTYDSAYNKYASVSDA